jgi:hypothetical protein
MLITAILNGILALGVIVMVLTPLVWAILTQHRDHPRPAAADGTDVRTPLSQPARDFRDLGLSSHVVRGLCVELGDVNIALNDISSRPVLMTRRPARVPESFESVPNAGDLRLRRYLADDPKSR